MAKGMWEWASYSPPTKVHEWRDKAIKVAFTNYILCNMEFIISVSTQPSKCKISHGCVFGVQNLTVLSRILTLLSRLSLNVTIVLTCWGWLRRVAVHSSLQRKIKALALHSSLGSSSSDSVDEDPFTRAQTSCASACLFWITMLLRAILLFF